MNKYIGVKVIEAKAMSAKEASVLLQRPVDTANGDTGYLVRYPDGYVSWSPASAFEEAYRKTDGMTFGLAVEAAKKGSKIVRTGCNGKGMFVVYQKGYPQGIPCNKQTAEAFKIKEGDLFICNPYLQIKNVNGSCSMWVPSINDCLSDDWQILE